MSQNFELGDTRNNGVWLVGSADLDALDASAHADGHRVRRISLAGCHAKADLLHRTATALAFPAHFGGNWDALADCLGDLSWLPQAGGYALLFDHAGELRDASEQDFDTFCDVLENACAQWRDRGVPCFAFLAMPDDAFAH